jgi:hypothetical protein
MGSSDAWDNKPERLRPVRSAAARPLQGRAAGSDPETESPAVIHPVPAPPPLARLLPAAGNRAGRSRSAPGRPRRSPWFIIGWLLGLIGGAAGLFGLLLIAPHHSLLPQVPPLTEPDITITISESYLNSQARQALKTTHPIVLPYVTVTDLELDLQPGNRMRLQPTFHAAVVDVAATVENNVRLDNSQLALQMNGDPKIQDIPIPLDWLPFNLPQEIRQGVDSINNDLLSGEINRQFSAGFGCDQFRITAITTDDNAITFKLKRK